MMKKASARRMLAAALATVLTSGVATAAEATALTRAQWLKKIGESVTQDSVLRETAAQVALQDRVEFTQRILRAVYRLPVNPEEKAAAFVRAAVACIDKAPPEVRYKVIAEVFANVPVEFLPVVTEELAKRFDQEYNKLSDAEYEVIATAAVSEAIARNAKTDEPSVRNTFVILAFLRGAKDPNLKEKLLALLPTDRMRGLVAGWLPPALAERNYDGLLAAADVDILQLANETIFRLLGDSPLERLLAQMRMGEPLVEVLGMNLGSLPSTSLLQPVDFGINRLPRFPTGYQNQGITTVCPPVRCPPIMLFGQPVYRSVPGGPVGPPPRD